jgi:diguanylate cyclase (GGDEF)-like protein
MLKWKIFLLCLIISFFPARIWAAESNLIIQLPWDHQFQFAGFYQALWQGYYSEAGIKVEIRNGINEEGNVIDAIEAIASGDADIAPLDGLSLLIAQDKGADIVALHPILQRTPWLFHSLQDQPLNSLSDLAKSPIATSPDSILIYKLLLKYGELKPDPSLIISEPPTIDSLVNGTAKIVSDYADSTTWMAKQMELRLNTLYAEDYQIDFYADVITVNRNRLQADPVLIEKFLQATFRGWEYALDNKEKTIEEIVKVLPRKLQAVDLKGFNRYLATRYHELTRYPQISLGNSDPERWKRMHEALKEIGVVSNDLDINHQILVPTSKNEPYADWLLITLLFSSLAAVTLLAGWPGQHRQGYLVPLVAVIFTLILIFLAVTLYREQEIENQKQETLIKLSMVRVQIEESINSTIFLIKGLITHIQLNPELTQDKFERISRLLIEDHPKIRNIAAAPNSIIQWVYPFENNQEVIGLDYRELPKQYPGVLKAKESGQVVIAGPLQLVQGGIGLIGRLPVYIKNKSGEREFWGIVAAVINVDAFYRSAGLYDSSLGLEFAIRGKDGAGDKGETFYGDMNLFDNDQSVLMNVFIPGGFWQIAARPIGGWSVSSKPIIFIYVLGLISIFLAILSYRIRRTHESQRRENEQYVSYLAYHDSLTGLPNRAQFMEELDRELSHAQRTKNIIALLMLDLDHFKHINDTMGHAAGDQILIEVSRRLKDRVRKEDHMARLGGDEFAIIQRDLNTLEDAVSFGQELLTTLSQPYEIKQTKFQSGVSIGIAIWQPGRPIDANLLEQADIALYKAKEERGRFAFYTSIMTREIKRRVDLRNDLEEALNTDQLFLVYQPQIDIRSNELIGVEALLRWKHPEKGFVAPDEFIPIAEMHGMMHRLGFRVLKDACEAFCRWRGKGENPGVMAVNVSPNQLDSEVFGQKVIDLLDRLGLAGEMLELEVTERVTVQPRTDPGRILHELADKGIKLSMDDFGTGYSSLLTLRRWPFHRLKIAQEFVRDMLFDQNDREIVKATIGLAENLGLQVIAEGVEEMEQLEFLKQNGCCLIQGYLIARPMTEDKLIEWMQKRNIENNAELSE